MRVSSGSTWAAPFGGREAELGRVTADRVDQLRAIGDQALARCHQHLRGLALRSLDGHEAHARPAHRLADRIGIVPIVLAAPYVWLHVLRWHQFHLVPQRGQLAGPVIRPAAGLHADLRRRQPFEKAQHIAPAQLLAQHRLLRCIHPMQLENTLGRVDTNSDNLAHGRLPCLRSNRPHSGTLMPLGAVHPNITTSVRVG